MTIFPRYESYKDSGVAGLGEVPRHWDGMPLKFMASHNDEVLDENTDPKFEILYVDIAGVDPVAGIIAKDPMPFSSAPSRARRKVRDGDVMVSTVRTYLRAIARITAPEENLVVSTGFAVVRPSKRMFHGFLGYLLSAGFFVDEVISRSVGISYPAINASDLMRITVPAPSFTEQQTIAAFLDRETGKIDALITEQRSLIDLLKEKRQAIISHAVAKGLNPHVPMKESGVEWLGEVPEHWEVVPIKRVLSIPMTDGPHETPVFVDDGGVPFISAEAVKNGFINFNDRRANISEEDHARFSRKYKPMRGDVYMVKSGATTGTTAIVETDREFNIWSPLAAMRCAEILFPEFLLFVLRSRNFQDGIALNWSYGTQENIGMGVIENLPIPVPPLKEQLQIIRSLTFQSLRVDALIAESEQGITLLHERRSALISAAVTGKIDVRSFIEEVTA